MTGARRMVRRRVAVGALVVLPVLLSPVTVAQAAVADCGGGRIQLLQEGGLGIDTVTGVLLTGVGAACDGQPVGVQLLGNAEGDPTLPADELAHAYSDEDPCTGLDVLTGGVLDGGTVEIPLCAAGGASGYVDGAQLTRVRLITADAAPDPDPVPDPDPDPGPAPDPAPEPVDDDLPVTGADAVPAGLAGALSTLVGLALLRLARRRSGFA